MPVLPNYLALGRGTECVGPAVMEAFRQHFYEAVDVGGNEQGFMARWNAFRESLLSAAWMSAEDSEDDQLRHESINNMGAQLDSLYNLILGMGQLAFAWQLIPIPTEISLEGPEIVSVTSSGRAKTKEARRFTHVLSNIIAKNFRVEGPHGVPAEARRNVPDEDGMISEMMKAMADRTEILDFADTKPFKDHWQNMREPDFCRLAKTLIYHINELHQGIDYVEGFCYTDRYRNLISLLKGCKGTIYFMSRPSTYEDVILNPHMMRLRFADNQKNNSKKKADNKELTSRRNSEYISLHGCPPPPKPRAVKGRKRAASSMAGDENDDASPSPARPAAKRQKPAPRNSRTAAGVAFGAGESSSAQPAVSTPIDTTFMDVPDLSKPEFYQLQQQFLAPDEQQQQPYYPSLEQNQQYYSPAQHQQTLSPQLPQQPTPRRSASGRQRRNIPKELHTKAAASSSNVGLGSPFLDQSNDIENQIATTLADAVRGNTFTTGPPPMLDFESSPPNETCEASQQLYQQTAFYQTQGGLYPDISVSPVLPVHDQIAQLQFLGQGSPAGNTQFRQDVDQGLTSQQQHHQPHDQHYMSADMLNSNSYWGEETATPDFSSFTEAGQAGLGDEANADQLGAVDPDIFDQQIQGSEVLGTNYFGIDTSAPGFGDLDLGSNISSGYLSYLPSTNTGGQGSQSVLGGQLKMKEMEDMLAVDP